MKKYYGYDENFIYHGQVKGQKNPRGTGFLIPARATEKAPPKNVGPQENAIFDPEKEKWRVKKNKSLINELLQEENEDGILTHKEVDGFAVEKSKKEVQEEKDEIEKAKLEKEKTEAEFLKKNQYKIDRAEAYEKEGLSMFKYLEYLTEGNTEKMEEYKRKKEEIQKRYPKP